MEKQYIRRSKEYRQKVGDKMDKKRQRKRSRRRRLSHRQKIVYMQIGAITVAIFLALLVGAAALTKELITNQNNKNKILKIKIQLNEKMQNKNSRKKK